MNPETKITTEELQRICLRHGIAYVSHERITTGFSHEVHRLNDDLVIKLFNKESKKNYICESRILGIEGSEILKPRLVATFEDSEMERAYIIMSYVPGKSLGSIWHLATDQQREDLIKQIAIVLRAFQSIDPTVLDFKEIKSSRDYLQNKSEKLITNLLAKKIVSEERALEVRSVVGRMLDYFPADEPAKPVYWDIHFDNFIVDEQYILQAIIDLENVRTLPLDYPLFVIEKQMRDPKKYLAEEDEKYADTKDYIHLEEWYNRYYPEMFKADHLQERIKLYRLLDELHLMIDWSHDAELRDSFTALLAELQST